MSVQWDGCQIVAVGRRRDGGTRFWCLKHRADGTAKYGKAAERCRYAGVPPVLAAESLSLDIRKYPGGIGLWGAVPPVYDTTRRPLDRGVHVHARARATSGKKIDRTYRQVVIVGASGLGARNSLSELDAIYFMTASVFGFATRFVECTRCLHPHLDKDWFSVHPHRRHLCAGCGQNFRDSEAGIGNPACWIRDVLQSGKKPSMHRAKERLSIRQSEYPGGIQVWGSNPAIVWTSPEAQEIGIHVHAFRDEASDGKPAIDGTFARVVIDGLELNEAMVRTLMAQRALPHLDGRITALKCDRCEASVFDQGADALAARGGRVCAECGAPVAGRGRLRNVVSNPLLATLGELEKTSPRPGQSHKLDLIPETL